MESNTQKAPVEGFKLTKDQKEWQKVMNRVHQIERGLATKVMTKMSELEEAQQMHKEAAGEKKRLLDMAPTEGVKELPGQEGR